MRAIRLFPAVLLLCAIAATAQPRSGNSTIRFGMTSSVIESDVNPDDAMAAAVIWIGTIGKGTGLWNNTEGRIYKDISSLAAAAATGDADILAMGTQEYLEVKDSLRAVPSLTYVQAGQVDTQYLLLVRNDSGIKSVADLRGRRVAMPRGGRNTITPMWLDVLLYESGLGRKESFFREIKNVQRPSQAILPVFFNQIDAGVVVQSAYETAIELNPQIGQQTRALAESPKLVMLVVCMRSGLPAGQREQFIREALKLHENPAGLQTFNIFKLDRIVTWDSSYFNNVAELMRKHNLAKSAAPLQARSKPVAETGK